MDDAKYKELQELGRTTSESIRGMVAAFECDYDRLQELRGERENHSDGVAGNGPLLWDAANPGDAEELAALESAAGDCESQDDAAERISEDPLSIELRSDWYTADDPPSTPGEFRILLGTGGPAMRIVGDLDANCEPSRARIEVQDWFTSWTEYTGDIGDRGYLLTYCQQFYFGEG